MNNVPKNRSEIATIARAGAEAAREIHIVSAMLHGQMRELLRLPELDRGELAAALNVLEQIAVALREFRRAAEELAADVDAAEQEAA